LAKSLVSVANGAGLKTTALITDMDEPLASAAGNALEVLHAVEFLKGRLINKRVEAITLALGAELLLSAGIVSTLEDGTKQLAATITSGRAAEHFAKMTALLGGPADFMARPEHYMKPAKIIRPVYADDEGAVSKIETRQLGLAVIELGGGRLRADDKIDHAVGLSNLLGKNFRADMNTPLCMIHAQDETSFDRAAHIVKAAYSTGDAVTETQPIIKRITA
jgi:thymidine phosphorylase